MPVCADPAAVLEQQVPMYHLDDDHRYIMIMGVGPEGSDGNYQSFAPFQIPIEYDYDVLDLKHIIQAQLGYEPDEINLRVAGDFRPDESKLGPIFGRWFKEGWHMQASVYPKGWKSALEGYQDENGKNWKFAEVVPAPRLSFDPERRGVLLGRVGARRGDHAEERAER